MKQVRMSFIPHDTIMLTLRPLTYLPSGSYVIQEQRESLCHPPSLSFPVTQTHKYTGTRQDPVPGAHGAPSSGSLQPGCPPPQCLCRVIRTAPTDSALHFLPSCPLRTEAEQQIQSQHNEHCLIYCLPSHSQPFLGHRPPSSSPSGLMS